MSGKDIPTATRTALVKRSGDRCEICGLRKRVYHVSHRVAKGMGGSRSKPADWAKHWRLSNIARACLVCHIDNIERDPQKAYAWGWKIKHGRDPRNVPIFLQGSWFLLDDYGAVTPCAAPAGLSGTG